MKLDLFSRVGVNICVIGIEILRKYFWVFILLNMLKLICLIVIDKWEYEIKSNIDVSVIFFVFLSFVYVYVLCVYVRI